MWVIFKVEGGKGVKREIWISLCISCEERRGGNSVKLRSRERGEVGL